MNKPSNDSDGRNAAVIDSPAGVKDPSGLSEKWRAFGRLWAEPFNAFLTLILLAMYGLGLAGLDGAVGVLSQTVLALASGVLGGRIANAVSVVNSEAILKARGTVAVRGLNLMLRNVGALDRRVVAFLKEGQGPGECKNYEHIREMCRVLAEEGVTSIENWTDIVPEARAATIGGQLSDLRDAIDSLESEKTELETKLAGAAAAGAETEQAMKDRIAAKDERIRALEMAYANVAKNALALGSDRKSVSVKNSLASYLELASEMWKEGPDGKIYYMGAPPKGDKD